MTRLGRSKRYDSLLAATARIRVGAGKSSRVIVGRLVDLAPVEKAIYARVDVAETTIEWYDPVTRICE